MSDPERFKRFWKEYSLLQGERNRNGSRDYVREGLQNFVARNDAQNAAIEIKTALELEKKHLSLISKLNAFRDPAQFIATDKWNRKGLQKITEVRDMEYTDHLHHCRSLASELSKTDFISNCFGKDLPVSEDHLEGFTMRVVDCFLMRVGGRWPV